MLPLHHDLALRVGICFNRFNVIMALAVHLLLCCLKNSPHSVLFIGSADHGLNAAEAALAREGVEPSSPPYQDGVLNR